jgi:transcriptional regulator with XRE-family HTH domain
MKFRLKEIRERSKISQSDLSQILNVSPSAVGMWEQGRREPDYATLNALADIFDVSIDYLLGREDSSKLPKEESQLLRSFNSLTKEGKAALLTILDSLKMSHSATA